jgi:hypothetical protein
MNEHMPSQAILYRFLAYIANIFIASNLKSAFIRDFLLKFLFPPKFVLSTYFKTL